MYLTTLDPISRDFDRIVRRAFGTAPFGTASAPVLPMDTIRHDGGVVLRFDIPGVPEEQIDVTVDRGVLTVSASRDESLAEGENLIVRERPAGSFARRVRLADNLDASAIEASYRDGVLEIRVPARPEARPRKITIGSASQAAELADSAGEPAN